MMASNVSSISEELLADSYLLSSVLFVNPEKMEKESTDDRIQNLCLNLKEAGLDDIATQFEKFHAKLWEISEEEHLFALEMTPSSPPYLGHYGFDAPKTCGEIGVSERNMYMIEVAAVYKHYGIQMEHGEMPDYFPAICEFMAISLAEEDEEARRLRSGFINSLVKPFLPKFIKGLGTKPWVHIVSAVEMLVMIENPMEEE